MLELSPFQASIAAVALIIVLIGVLWFCWMLLRRWFRSHRHDPRDRRAIASQWKAIDVLRQSGDPHQLQIAVVKADQLFDQLLKLMIMPGSSFAERLKAAQHKYPELKDVWWAHKVRNDVVHENRDQATRRLNGALNEFEKAFKRLGVL